MAAPAVKPPLSEHDSHATPVRQSSVGRLILPRQPGLGCADSVEEIPGGEKASLVQPKTNTPGSSSLGFMQSVSLSKENKESRKGHIRVLVLTRATGRDAAMRNSFECRRSARPRLSGAQCVRRYFLMVLGACTLSVFPESLLQAQPQNVEVQVPAINSNNRGDRRPSRERFIRYAQDRGRQVGTRSGQ